MTIRRNNTVQTPNLGLYLGMAPTRIPKRAMVACQNVRIKLGRVIHDNLGWSDFPNAANKVNLDAKPVTLIDSFVKRDGATRTIFGNTTDLFEYGDISEAISYITPRYEVGTATVVNGSPVVVGVGTVWLTNVKVGDKFSFGATETDPAAIWYEVLTIDTDLQITLTTNYAEASAGPAAYTIRKLFTGAIDDPWFTEKFYNGSGLGGPSATGDRWYATNGIDAVVGWDGAADVVYFPNLANVQTCQSLANHKNKMIYVAPTVAGAFEKYSIRTSDIGNPEDTVTGAAVELIVKDGADPLIRALPLGEQLALYGEEGSITLAQSVSIPLVYVFRTVVSDYGPISPRGIAVYPDFHDFVGADRQYRFNGAVATPINDHVWRDVLRRTTPERKGFLHSHFDEEQGELLWAVPLTTDTDTAAGTTEEVYTAHYMEDVGERNPQPYTRREIPALCFGSYLRQSTLTWADISEAWEDFNYRWNDKFFFAQFPITLFGDALGNVFSLNTSPTKNGVPLDNSAHFARVAVGNQEFSSVIRRIYPYIEQLLNSTDTVTIWLYGSDTVDGVAQLISTLTFSTGIGTTQRFVSPRKATRYAEVEIGVDGGINYWAVSGYAIDTVPGSGR